MLECRIFFKKRLLKLRVDTTQFQNQPFWVADKRVELDGIKLDAGDISLTFQWHEQIPGISGSYMVYRLFCDNSPQVQSHNQVVHGNI